MLKLKIDNVQEGTTKFSHLCIGIILNIYVHVHLVVFTGKNNNLLHK